MVKVAKVTSHASVTSFLQPSALCREKEKKERKIKAASGRDTGYWILNTGSCLLLFNEVTILSPLHLFFKFLFLLLLLLPLFLLLLSISPHFFSAYSLFAAYF